MKLIQLVTRRQRRGAEVFAADLSEQLIQQGHEVYFVGLYEPPSDGNEVLSVNGAENIDLNGKPAKLNPVIVWRLAKLITQVAPDLVQANGSDTLKYSALAKRLLFASWPLVYRNISVASHWLGSSLQKQWIRWLLGSFDRVVSVSERSRQDFVETYAFPAERTSAVPRALRLGTAYEKAPSRARLAKLAGTEAEGPFLAHVGSFSEEKNHQWLLDVFAEVLKSRPDAQLFLVGDGPLYEAVKRRRAALGLEGRVHLLGYRSDVERLLAGADLFVLPSLIEGIPGVILEAASQRVPSVATDVGGVSEALRHGKNGLLVSSGDSAAFRDAVVRLLEDEEERNSMGEHARRAVLEHHDIHNIAQRFEMLYLSLLQG